MKKRMTIKRLTALIEHAHQHTLEMQARLSGSDNPQTQKECFLAQGKFIAFDSILRLLDNTTPGGLYY
jgi:hypothetical protein